MVAFNGYKQNWRVCALVYTPSCVPNSPCVNLIVILVLSFQKVYIEMLS